jgi:hypothetical protein
MCSMLNSWATMILTRRKMELCIISICNFGSWCLTRRCTILYSFLHGYCRTLSRLSKNPRVTACRISKRLPWRGSCSDLSDVLSRHLSRGTEESHEKTSLGIAGVYFISEMKRLFSLSLLEGSLEHPSLCSDWDMNWTIAELGKEIFILSYDQDWHCDSPGPCPMGTGISFLGVKWRGCEADHSYSPSADVKIIWNYTSIPPYILMM